MALYKCNVDTFKFLVWGNLVCSSNDMGGHLVVIDSDCASGFFFSFATSEDVHLKTATQEPYNFFYPSLLEAKAFFSN